MKEQRYPQLDERAVTATLPNGLPVCVVPKPGFAKKCAYFVTNYGSMDTKFTWMGRAYDTPAGVAHYLEHKMFEMPDRDVMQEFSALGANPNAFTSYNMTAYYFTCTEHFEACLELLSRQDRPTAIFGGNDVMAAGAMKAALRLGLRVPEDLAVTGLDDSSACGMLEPELTSVHIDCRRMGELSVARLQALLAGETDVPQVTVVPTELRVRGSS